MRNSVATRQRLCEIAALEGVKGAALVDGASGMVWFSESQLQQFGVIAEVAIESWRLKRRHSEALAAMGGLRLTATHFDHGTLIAVPIGQAHSFLLVVWLQGGKLKTSTWREQAVLLTQAMET